MKKKSSATEYNFKPESKGEIKEERPKSSILVKNKNLSKMSKEEDFNLDDVFSNRTTKVKATLEQIKKEMERIKLTGSPMILKEYHLRCYPYLISTLSSEMEEAHAASLNIIRSSFGHFNACNEAYAFMIDGILGLYEKYPKVCIILFRK